MRNRRGAREVAVTATATGVISWYPCPSPFSALSLNDSGGAVDSGAGLDRFVESTFTGNSARVGGAVRLAGTASFANCTFVENASSNGEGSAISNIGYISSIYNSSFRNNVFECDAGTFLDFNTVSVMVLVLCFRSIERYIL